MTEGSTKAKKNRKKPLAGDRVKQYICIICPNCCELETDGTEVNGAKCEKGEGFAKQEMIRPLRVITTTVPCETPKGKRMVPVKTVSPVPLEQVFEMMKEIKALSLKEVPSLGSRITLCTKDGSKELVVTGE